MWLGGLCGPGGCISLFRDRRLFRQGWPALLRCPPAGNDEVSSCEKYVIHFLICTSWNHNIIHSEFYG